MDEFNDKIGKAKDKLSVVYFYSPYNKENKRVDIALDQLAATHASKLLVLSVNIDEITQLELFSIVRGREFPTFIFYKNLEHADQFSGADVQKLEQTITRLINWKYVFIWSSKQIQ